MRITGQCHCGNVQFEAEADPHQVGICHCTDCQRLSGSPFRVTLLAKRSDIKLTGGEPKIYRKAGDNGNMRHQHFCGDCGSPLFTSAEVEDDNWGIRWGAINGRSALKPRAQIWTRSKAEWLDEIGSLPSYPKDFTK